jgi:DNA-binding transcriptional LysR family regulator
VASAAAGNFSRAAKSLGLATSTISRRVARLEDELGLALFERGHAGIRLTAGGKAVLVHARRAVAELEAVKCAGKQNGTGSVGEVRLGVRMPLIGAVMHTLLTEWRQKSSNIMLTVSEMNDRDLVLALDERRLDVALAPRSVLPAHVPKLPVYRERLFVAVPLDHALTGELAPLTKSALVGEIILVQGWEESQGEREFLAPLLGNEVLFQSHAASRQSILALVSAGYGISIGTESEATAGFPGVLFRPIDEKDAVLMLELAWLPETEEPAVGRFVAFVRDAVRSRGLV